MAKSFGELFSKSWGEYKVNFDLILKVFLTLVAIPSLLIFAFRQIFSYQPSLAFVAGEISIGKMITYFAIFIILEIIALVLSTLMILSLISAFLSDKPITSMPSAIKNGTSYLLKAIGLSIVMTIFLVILYLLLIVPGIIFTIYWAFAFYVLIGENKGISESLSGSKQLVKGRWWSVLGYSLSFIFVSIIILIPFIIVNLLVGEGVVGNTLDTLVMLASSLILQPLSILFYKNIYLELKENKAG